MSYKGNPDRSRSTSDRGKARERKAKSSAVKQFFKQLMDAIRGELASNAKFVVPLKDEKLRQIRLEFKKGNLPEFPQSLMRKVVIAIDRVLKNFPSARYDGKEHVISFA